MLRPLIPSLLRSASRPMILPDIGSASPPVGSIVSASSRALALVAGTAGTLSTWGASGFAAWTGGSTAYNASPKFLIDGYRVTNSGRSYELNQNGVGAASGGPTGTTQTEADNTARWGHMGAGNGGLLSTVSGSKLLVCCMRGNHAAAPSPNAIDVSGGQTPTTLAGGPRSYAAFPQSASMLQIFDVPAGFSNHQIDCQYGPFSGGQRDEVSAQYVCVSGVSAVETTSYVEVATSTGGFCTTAPITTTVATLYLVFWLGNGNVITVGNKHVATPNDGLSAITFADTTLALDAAGYIQSRVFFLQLSGPVTNFTTRISTTLNEGAQLYAVALKK
jgi:hypothetical protein